MSENTQLQKKLKSPVQFKILGDNEQIGGAGDFTHTRLPLLHSSISKLSEGSFGEIFEITKATGEKRILKIVPVGDTDPQTKQLQLTFKDITAEISASVELAKLLHDKRNHCPSFPRIYRVCVVQDTFPETAIKAWKAYSSSNSTYHPSPDAYKPDQAFITIETESAGKSLENYLVGSYLKAISIFKQVALAVAVAEEKLEFEHRDLHVENILIKECAEKKLDFKLRNQKFSVETYGVKATIIDFTYSRIMTGDGVKYLNLDNIYDPRSRSPDEFLDHRYVYARMGEMTQ
ncbi:serine/threonine-protein kinase haspin-like [Stegodyphus dumicola]|uniref:serine/threonine-protein kinase haspin-like n=1 Tax=Stegodyphus dumicola TaxID=202533 RepID=UPI0015AB6432|nr:serine/threonine-protein kinase haspin-like [Stegodyphus dumicola]